MRQPQVGADGNTIGGLPNTNMLVPLGTYLGWNVRKAGFSEGDSCDLTGAFVPFFRTLAKRQAANSLVSRRLLLPEDATFLINQANAAVVP